MENKEVDVIFYVMFDYWYVFGFILSMQGGKYVYVEKFCSYNLVEGEMLIVW